MSDSYIQNLFSERIGGVSYGKDTAIYKFEKIKRAKKAALEANPDAEIIDMGVGEPDEMAFPEVVSKLHEEAQKPENRGYSDNSGQALKIAAANFLQQECGVNNIDPDTDVLTRMIIAEESNLSETELLQNCIFILNAGHETTTNLIGNALWALCTYPMVRKTLIKNPAILNSAIDEFLRFLSPNQFGNRETAFEVSLSGKKIPKNTNLHLCIGAANRDPLQFKDPEELIIDRTPNRHLAFAGGAHHCVGFSLAKMEARIAIGMFLRNFPNYNLISKPRWSRRIRFRGLTHLHARLER